MAVVTIRPVPRRHAPDANTRSWPAVGERPCVVPTLMCKRRAKLNSSGSLLEGRCGNERRTKTNCRSAMDLVRTTQYDSASAARSPTQQKPETDESARRNRVTGQLPRQIPLAVAAPESHEQNHAYDKNG